MAHDQIKDQEGEKTVDSLSSMDSATFRLRDEVDLEERSRRDAKSPAQTLPEAQKELTSAMEKSGINSTLSKSMKTAMADFEKRDNLSNSQKAQTYHNVSRLLTEKGGCSTEARAQIAKGVLENAAHPERISTGTEPGNSKTKPGDSTDKAGDSKEKPQERKQEIRIPTHEVMATMESQLYTQHPERISKLIADALSGKQPDAPALQRSGRYFSNGNEMSEAMKDVLKDFEARSKAEHPIATARYASITKTRLDDYIKIAQRDEKLSRLLADAQPAKKPDAKPPDTARGALQESSKHRLKDPKLSDTMQGAIKDFEDRKDVSDQQKADTYRALSQILEETGRIPAESRQKLAVDLMYKLAHPQKISSEKPGAQDERRKPGEPIRIDTMSLAAATEMKLAKENPARLARIIADQLSSQQITVPSVWDGLGSPVNRKKP